MSDMELCLGEMTLVTDYLKIVEVLGAPISLIFDQNVFSSAFYIT